MLPLTWQVFTQGGINYLDTLICFNVKGSAAFHGCCYLSSLLNPWEQNGFVWLGAYSRNIWESHFLPLGSAKTDSMTLVKSLHHTIIPFSTCNLGPWYTRSLGNRSWSALRSIRWCRCCCLSASSSTAALGAGLLLFCSQVILHSRAAGAGIQQVCIQSHGNLCLSQI